MHSEERRCDDVVVITLIGEFGAFDLRTFSAKVDTLVESGHTKLCFDLRRLTYINSAALGYLIRTKKRAEKRGGDLVLVNPSKFVSRTLHILGLDELFKLFEDDADAIGYFRGATGR